MGKVRKAIVGGVTAGIAAFVAAFPDGVNGGEIGTILGSIVVAGLAVYGVKNDTVVYPSK
jgi:hypothetical protein